jgi:hypothetical protein
MFIQSFAIKKDAIKVNNHKLSNDGDSPGGISSGNTSSYPCKTSRITLGVVEDKSLLEK